VPDPFEAWRGELAQLVDAHFTAGASTGDEGSLSGQPSHDPTLETITDVEVGGEQATVRSVLENGSVPTYYEYRLVHADGQWRIRELLRFLEPPGSPLVPSAEAAALLDAATYDVALPERPADLELDLPSLFAEGRLVSPFGETVPLEVARLGEVTCRSGVLTVRDFGYGGFDLAPLARRVPAGTYRAEVSSAAGTNVALRLLLSDAPVVSWHPAETPDGSNVVGVDAGNVAIADLATLVRCEAQHVEELFLRESDRMLTGTVFSLTGEVNDAVMVTSGYGDGAYPVYWGVADDGSIASLVVDFVVLVEEIVRVVAVPWQVGPVNSPELAGHDVAIAAEGEAFVISRRGHQITKLRVLSPDGTVLVDGDRLGLTQIGNQNFQTWRPRTPPPPGATLEFTVHGGYRHT
jgi:hypothetical protein